MVNFEIFYMNYDRLEPDVRGSLIALLAMEQDAKRAHRVPGDTFCSMIYDLQFGKRKIKWGINKF